MTHRALAWLPPSLWKPVTLLWLLCTAVYLTGLLELYSGTTSGGVIYSGGIQGAVDCAGRRCDFCYISWGENASPNLSHWRRCNSACGSQSLGIITEDGTWCCPWSFLQNLFGQYKGQKAKDKPEYNTAFMSRPRGYYNAQTLPTLWKKGRAECVSISHILPQKSEDARDWGMSCLDCV